MHDAFIFSVWPLMSHYISSAKSGIYTENSSITPVVYLIQNMVEDVSTREEMGVYMYSRNSFVQKYCLHILK